MLAVCLAIAVASKVLFQIVRATLVLQRQFKGPPSGSLLMGDLMMSWLMASHMQPASSAQADLAFTH